MIGETGWRWDEVRDMRLARLWLLFQYWARRAGGGAGIAPPAPSEAEVAAAFARVSWRS